MLQLTRSLRVQTHMRMGIALTRRSYSTPAATEEIRKRLTDELKGAMKSKDIVKSTTIRSVLSEVYAQDKTQAQPLSSSAIVSIIRKATADLDAATEFEKAQRPELAEKERKEADLLQVFLPALLQEADIDRTLQAIIDEQKPTANDKRALGAIFKAFYSKVDRSLVDSDLVKKRAEALIVSHA
ncbi:Yqey-like protein-domain-containing protein [Irpex lacteus]|nr:Yqey-like protein-domain-containing protein [Irpex lacteus]